MLSPCCYATFNPDTRQASHDECISLALQSRKQTGLLERGKKNPQGAIRQSDVTALCSSWSRCSWVLLILCGPSFGKVPMPDPLLHSPLPTLLVLYQPVVLGRASQVSPLPLGPVSDDKELLTLSLCKLLVPLFLVLPHRIALPAAELVQDTIACPSWEGGGWAGVMHVLPLALECQPANLTAAPEPGVPWDTLLLPAAGVAWCHRKSSTAVVAWITAPEQRGSGASRPEGKSLLPASLISRLDPPSGCSSWLVICVAARCSGECLCALGVKQHPGGLG